MAPQPTVSHTYYLYGQSRVNQNSIDLSTNIANPGLEPMFASLRQAVAEQVTDPCDQEELLNEIDAAEQAKDTTDLKDRLGKVAATGLKYLDILGPIITEGIKRLPG